MNKPNQKSSNTAASPSVTQKPAAKPVAKSTVSESAMGAPVKATDAPMHAAKGNDDTMSQPQARSQPQASKPQPTNTQPGKKES